MFIEVTIPEIKLAGGFMKITGIFQWVSINRNEILTVQEVAVKTEIYGKIKTLTHIILRRKQMIVILGRPVDRFYVLETKPEIDEMLQTAPSPTRAIADSWDDKNPQPWWNR